MLNNLLVYNVKGRRHHFFILPNGTVRYGVKYISHKTKVFFIDKKMARLMIEELKNKGAKVTKWHKKGK